MAYPPFSYADAETDEPTGFDLDFWNAVCEELNCEPNFVTASWEGFFEAMEVGEYDVGEGGLTLTLARAMRVDVSMPYAEYGQVILKKADDDRDAFADEETFVASDLTIGTQIGTTNEIAALKMVTNEERVVSFETYDMPVVSLLAGDVDSVIIDEVAAVGFMQQHPGELEVAFTVTGGEYLVIYFPPKSDLLVPVNWAIKQMFEDGTMDEICEKWILRPCTPE
jgi:ABC-type amino acid transport substrate-binding protein